MSDGVLPGSLVGPVVGEPLHDELIDSRQGDPLLRVLLDRHGNQSDVAGTHRRQLLDQLVEKKTFVPTRLGLIALMQIFSLCFRKAKLHTSYLIITDTSG